MQGFVAADVPFALRATLATIVEERTKTWDAQRAVLTAARGRLQDAIVALQASPDQLGVRRTLEGLGDKLELVTRALAALEQGKPQHDVAQNMHSIITRFKVADTAARQKRLQARLHQQTAIERFLPAGPRAALGVPSLPPSEVVEAALPPSGTFDGAALPEGTDLTAQFLREAAIVLGNDARPVQLTPFDTCPKCKVAMRYNATLQQLVCPKPECGHWKRFADMTSSALAYGEEVQYTKYSYKPVSHLDDIMKRTEATETYVVPADALLKVIKHLYAQGVRNAEDITIAMVRTACKQVKVRMAHAVQIHSRITGRAPHRMTPFMKDQMRIMFHAAEAPYRKHAAGRTNHLSFPFTLRKYCELLGYWEMLPALPMLRGQGNVNTHDAITSRVFHDIGWSFCSPVYKNGVVVGATAATGPPGALPPAKSPFVRA